MLFKFAILALFPLLGLARFTPDYNLEFFNFSPFPDLYRRNYTVFTCWLSCKDRATVMCHYMGFPDEGNAARPSSFTYDPVVPRTCQQTSTGTYNSVYNGWDRYLIIILRVKLKSLKNIYIIEVTWWQLII